MDTDKLAAATDKLAAATASLTRSESPRSESPTQTAKALEVSRATLTGTPDAVTASGQSGVPALEANYVGFSAPVTAPRHGWPGGPR